MADSSQRRAALIQAAADLAAVRRTLGLLLGLCALAVLYVAQDFFLPVVLAFVLALVLRPISRGLTLLGLPAALGAAVIVLGLVAAVSTALVMVTEPAAKWVEDAPRVGRELQFKLRGVLDSAEALKNAGEQVNEIAKGGKEPGVQEVVVKEPGLLTQAATGAPDMVAAIVLLCFLLYFLLATADLFVEKLVRVLPRMRDKVRAVTIARTIEKEISRYLLTVTAINMGLGVCVGLAMAATGLPNAVLWGFMAAGLNFIPYLGSVVGAAIVLAVALVTFDSPGAIAAPPLLYLGLSTLEGQAITPTILGRRLEMNPVAIFLGVAFWGWLWGVPGAFLAVPMMLIVKVTSEHIDRFAALAEFLSARHDRGPAEKPK